MSLIPRLPCRKLFIDSRFAEEGNATDFVVQLPPGDLDLPGNCVAFIDQIGVPSFQEFLWVEGVYTIERKGHMLSPSAFLK